jgi:hypothetical protein
VRGTTPVYRYGRCGGGVSAATRYPGWRTRRRWCCPTRRRNIRLLYEPDALGFVPYLRLAILRRGGFPGLDGRAEGWELVATLTEGLEPF